jgi:hypothetical protein
MARSQNQVEVCIPNCKKVITPSPATWNPTGAEGEHEGVNHVEFELLDGEGARISLASDNIDYIKKNGVDLAPNQDETLWFSEENDAGEYLFELKTIAGTVYIAILEWTPEI